MQLVATGSTVTVTTANPTQTEVLTLKGLPPGTICRGLMLELNATKTNGGVPIAHEPEQLSQLIQNVTIKKPLTASASFKPDLNGINGRVFTQFGRINHATRNNLNQVLAAGAPAAVVNFKHYIWIPWVPNFPSLLDKPSRPLSEWLEGMSLTYFLSLSDYDTTNDIVQIQNTLRVYAMCEEKPAGYLPTEGGIVWREIADFENNDKQFITTFQPTLIYLRTRVAYSELTLRSGKDFYSNLTPLEIEMYQPYNRYYLHDEVRTTFQGDPMAMLVPTMASGISTTESGLVAMDIRNMKDVSAPLELRAFSKIGAIPHYIVGWQS